jgi:dimethylaniline monooxygenase (N-oxide forming)
MLLVGFFKLIHSLDAKLILTSFVSFGAAFTTFYRLVGPYASPLAPHISKTELWDTVTRRGLLGNLIMGLIPMVFYLAVSALALGLELALTLGGLVRV